MSSKLLIPIILFVLICSIVSITACKKEVAPKVKTNYSFVEEFDTVLNALDKGWKITNNSRPIGSQGWVQGDYGIDQLKGIRVGFPAHSSTYSGQDFIVSTYNAGDGDATLSTWLISPATIMKSGDEIIFYTRTAENPSQFPDRLQLRLNPVDNTTNVGSGRVDNMEVANMTGSFSELLLDINPNLVKSGTGAYPAEWTRYSAIIKSLPVPAERRFAFRYFVTNGGNNGVNSEAVGIDSVAFVSK